jgi:hypothetical protein
MRTHLFLPACLTILGTASLPAATAEAPPPARIDLHLDTDEAEAVLAILAKRGAGRPVDDGDWRRLFATEPYVRLKKREAGMHRDFTDDDFRTFVLSPSLSKTAAALRRTLEEWKKADLVASARRVLAYLPAQARIRARVYPVIKPMTNSFVFEPSTDPAIFLYLDPAISPAKFENTVAHELHHIGFASLDRVADGANPGLQPGVKTALEWMGAFGEGFAMLAAAGSPDVHPHSVSSAQERARWDKDMANFNQDLKSTEKFFLDIIHQTLRTPDDIQKVGSSFFGIQGPWYTVGYRMAVVIEKRYGRATLIECMLDPRELLARYNAAATELNSGGKEHLALWSPELLGALDRTGAGREGR